jgi:hypothetical protein
LGTRFSADPQCTDTSSLETAPRNIFLEYERIRVSRMIAIMITIAELRRTAESDRTTVSDHRKSKTI